MIEVDGSMMEGGGQLLRMAVTYSAIMGVPVKVRNIRGKRSPPGLKPQHLATLKAVEEVCDADTRGLNPGSREIEFHPKPPRGGSYSFDIGTAGSISLLLQCVAPIVAFADSASKIRIVGGTAVAWSPPVVTMDRVVWEAARQMGFNGRTHTLRDGFHPRGGGIVETGITPTEKLKPLNIAPPIHVNSIKGVSVCGRLPEHIAIRQARSAEDILSKAGYKTKVERQVLSGGEAPFSPGSYICLWAETEPKTFVGTDSLGEKGKPAEKVGAEAAESLLTELRAGASVDMHTADNLIIWCSLAEGESSFRTSNLTMHSATAVELARMITKAKFEVQGEIGKPALIRCTGVGLVNESL